jgi:RimJ/RimL family protein N-acetyltransferase
VITTDRLILREFTTDDTAFIIELLNTPGWLQFIGDRNVKSADDAKNYLLNGPIKSYLQHGFGLSMVELKSGIPIGMCGLIKRTYLETPDIGFAFLPAYNGKGYAFEIASAVLLDAAVNLKINQVQAITLQSNKSSVKLLEKLGMVFQKIIIEPSTNDELMLFSN